MIKQLLSLFISLYMLLVFTGCTAGLTDPEIDFEPPVYVEQMPAMEERQDFAATGSIFGQGDNPLFSDHKAMHVHDIVRVVISETAKSSSVAAKALSETDTSALGGGTFTAGGTSGTLAQYTNKLNNLTNIGFTANSTSNFAGSGSATKDASFTTTVSARIVKVLSNGNYFIVGKRELLIDKQKQIIQISGVIRPYDIDQFNKIDSAQMSEAKISYVTEGDVDRTSEQGWGTKIVQSVWPF
ncbi:MAG: flagellar basal body L-ring protein FlgH [Sulfurimonas sp.]|nr:flagellar basal body L-ring protein FlgH [Sulfurimonas sp.]MDQ7061120.1 flagellar basal body L-ring protein FlgH [Sulfurimonas sp.]